MTELKQYLLNRPRFLLSKVDGPLQCLFSKSSYRAWISQPLQAKPRKSVLAVLLLFQLLNELHAYCYMEMKTSMIDSADTSHCIVTE
ncbi:hypothetical protein CFP56_037459 [Quercus suber]|uniref:Uncharacterized protein n=1 Tax=Quercus suber TaxID=58331 RepID=A0AAW0LPR9_QUESU